MAHAFVLGARGSRDGRISKADAERAANELLDTGSVGELGVRLYVKLTDGVIGSGGGGWAVGFEDDDGREDTPRVVLP